MRKRDIVRLLAGLLFLGILLPTAGNCWQSWREGGGWGMKAPYQRFYNPVQVTVFTGVVLGVEEFYPLQGMEAGVHLWIRSGPEVLSVHLGPAWYIRQLNMRFRAGELVRIRGTRVLIGNRPAIIAAEISRGPAHVRLRNERGIPAWSAWRWYRR